MIKSALLSFEQRVGLHMETKAKEMVTIEQARVSLNDTMERIREEFKLSEKRLTELIGCGGAAGPRQPQLATLAVVLAGSALAVWCR